MSRDVGDAARAARRSTGLAIAVAPAPVAELPYDYERRLRPARGLRLAKLGLLFPDKYDLALANAVRGYQHDIDAVEGVHRGHRLSRNTLVERFETEMSHAFGDPARIRLNVAMVVARLYGIKAGQALAARWGMPVPRRR
jgi:hypothetical protein